MHKKIIKITTEQAVDVLESAAYEFADMDFAPSDFYCGITNDIERRQQEHNAKFITTLKVENVEMAKGIERAMNRRNYVTGKPANGAKPNSIYVYLYYITPDTNQLEDE